jgi:hypothetical protein
VLAGEPVDRVGRSLVADHLSVDPASASSLDLAALGSTGVLHEVGYQLHEIHQLLDLVPVLTQIPRPVQDATNEAYEFSLAVNPSSSRKYAEAPAYIPIYPILGSM